MSGVKICIEKKAQKSRTCSTIRKLSISEITITAVQLHHLWCETLKILGTWSLLHRTYVCPWTIIKKFYKLAATGDQLLLWSRKVSMFCIVTILLFCIPKHIHILLSTHKTYKLCHILLVLHSHQKIAWPSS